MADDETDITTHLEQWDVVVGRCGSTHTHHPGHKRLYEVMWAALPFYNAGSTKCKTSIIHAIYDCIVSQGGRFLLRRNDNNKNIRNTNHHYVLSDRRTAHKRISTGLRDAREPKKVRIFDKMRKTRNQLALPQRKSPVSRHEVDDLRKLMLLASSLAQHRENLGAYCIVEREMVSLGNRFMLEDETRRRDTLASRSMLQQQYGRNQDHGLTLERRTATVELEELKRRRHQEQANAQGEAAKIAALRMQLVEHNRHNQRRDAEARTVLVANDDYRNAGGAAASVRQKQQEIGIEIKKIEGRVKMLAALTEQQGLLLTNTASKLAFDTGYQTVMGTTTPNKVRCPPIPTTDLPDLPEVVDLTTEEDDAATSYHSAGSTTRALGKRKRRTQESNEDGTMMRSCSTDTNLHRAANEVEGEVMKRQMRQNAITEVAAALPGSVLNNTPGETVSDDIASTITPQESSKHPTSTSPAAVEGPTAAFTPVTELRRFATNDILVRAILQDRTRATRVRKRARPKVPTTTKHHLLPVATNKDDMLCPPSAITEEFCSGIAHAGALTQQGDLLRATHTTTSLRGASTGAGEVQGEESWWHKFVTGTPSTLARRDDDIVVAGRAESATRRHSAQTPAGWQQDRMDLMFTSAPLGVFIETKNDKRGEEPCLVKSSAEAHLCF